MSLATTIQATAQRALKSYGAPATLTRTTAGAFNPTTGESAPSTTSWPCFAVMDASSLAGLGARFGSDLVEASDMKATVSGVTPQVGDTLTVAGSTYTIKAVRPSFVQGQAVAHEMLVKL